MQISQEVLINFKPKHNFFIGIDSDGCVFDTMELKQKECFIPVTIREWGLQAISKYARETAEFVNLYSKWRGVNRFPALVKTFDFLRERIEVQRRQVTIPSLDSLRNFIDSGAALGNPALGKAVLDSGEETLTIVLKWSKAVNEEIAQMVKGIPPFPFVRESLEKASRDMDMIVVSQTPTSALIREWEENELDCFPAIIAGQEMGSKAQHIALATKGRYISTHILIIGDAPGDLKAAQTNNALFFPINPGYEEESWERFYEEGLDRFLNENYAGTYEYQLCDEFERLLPDIPPWKK